MYLPIIIIIFSLTHLLSVFETTIRYLGGLLSVYEFRGCKDEVLLGKAVEVADKMAHAWVGVSGTDFLLL